MKEMKFYTGKVKAIFATTFLASIIFSSNVLASDVKMELKTSEAYNAWKKLSTESRENTPIPRTYDVEVPEYVLSNYETNNLPRILNQLLDKKYLGAIDASVGDTRFNLADHMNIRVEDQGITSECWAFSLLKSMETNIALRSGKTEIDDFSERHMDYATSRTFTDGVNENGFDREVGNGGLLVTGLAYLTNGQGAVIEEDMPFVNEETKISLEEINKEVDTVVTGYNVLPTVHKKYTRDSAGNTTSVTYYKSTGEEYTEDELMATRDIIKEHLIEHGGIATMTGGGMPAFYNNESLFDSTAYNCNDSTRVRDHAVTIVGWDDTYPRENFGEGRMPSTDGAYIVLNSYSDTAFNDGYLYVSYEDYFIEEEIYGITSTIKKNYDNIYQHDYYGGIFQVGTVDTDTGFYGAVYDRDTTQNEILNSVAVSLSTYANIDIYVNPVSDDMDINSLMKVATVNEVLEPGYHRINISPVELSGDKFAIVIKQMSPLGTFFFQVESRVDGTVYGLVDTEDKSYYSIDGYVWDKISNLEIDGIEMKTADVCIKGFTTLSEEVTPPEGGEDPTPPEGGEDPTPPEGGEDPTPPEGGEDPTPPEGGEDPTPPEGGEDPTPPSGGEDPIPPTEDDKPKIELESEEFIIRKKYVMKIEFNTTVKQLLEKTNSSYEKTVLTSEGDTVLDTDIIKTGMKLKLSNGSIYTLIVRGDTNMDGRVSLTDLSKMILHYNGVKGFELSGDGLKGADMNVDGAMNLVDISQMLVLYNSI